VLKPSAASPHLLVHRGRAVSSMGNPRSSNDSTRGDSDCVTPKITGTCGSVRPSGWRQTRSGGTKAATRSRNCASATSRDTGPPEPKQAAPRSISVPSGRVR
jgi:hypothetical protein